MHSRILIWLITKLLIKNNLKNTKKLGKNNYYNKVSKIRKSLVICYLTICYLTDSFYNIIRKRLKIKGHFHLKYDKKLWSRFLQRNSRGIFHALQFNHQDFLEIIIIRFWKKEYLNLLQQKKPHEKEVSIVQKYIKLMINKLYVKKQINKLQDFLYQKKTKGNQWR